MNALVRKTSMLRLAVALFLLISASGCVTYYQPLHGHDGFYHEGRHGPDVIVVERYAYDHYAPAWHPLRSVPWLYVDRHHVAAAPALMALRRAPPPIETRRARRGIERPNIRHELPLPRSAERGSAGRAAGAPRPATMIHHGLPQRQAGRPRRSHDQEP